MKTLIVLSALVVASLEAPAQTIHGTFQGQIEGVSPFMLHVKGEGSTVEGFYRYPADHVVVFLKGNIDDAGNLALAAEQDGYPVIAGKLTGRLFEGNFAWSKEAEEHPFYAVDLRGEYHNQFNTEYLRLSLSENGYILKSLTRTDREEQISTFRSREGRIGLRADSLNTTLYWHGDTLVVDTLCGLPTFMSPNGEYSTSDLFFARSEEYWSSDSYAEFPEKAGDFIPEGITKELSQTISVRLTRIPQSEYIIGKWTSPPNRSYEAITDFAHAREFLGEKMKPVLTVDPETGEPLSAMVEITYNDGTTKTIDWLYDFENYPDAFYAYYPELDLLIFEGEAGGDEIIDFNDSSSGREVGNPAQTATSPDGEWRVTGYYPGGAADTDEWWLERCNPSNEKYEMALDFKNNYRVGEAPTFRMPEYINGWFWVDDRTVFFKSQFAKGNYYRLELIETGSEN